MVACLGASILFIVKTSTKLHSEDLGKNHCWVVTQIGHLHSCIPDESLLLAMIQPGTEEIHERFPVLTTN